MPSTGKSRWLECTIGASARRPRSSREDEMSRAPGGEVEGVGVHARRRGARAGVVAEERDAGAAVRALASEQSGRELGEPPREDRAPPVDPHDREAVRPAACRVLLDDLVGDAHERAPHVVAVEDDLLVSQTSALPGLTGPG